MALFGNYFKSTSQEVNVLRHDVGIFKNLINERQHPLDLIRELLSNAGASEVGATRIEIGYTKDKQGHVFEVSDNGCGMDFSNDPARVGRLDRFLGLGLSSIAGQESDEFSWKGLGSKLAYQSRKVMVETRCKDHPLYEVRINEPWDTLKRNEIPRPRVTEHKGPDLPPGTRIRVLGHPPHRQEQPFTPEDIRRFLLHRTFAGYTGLRPSAPAIVLSVMGHIERLEFGWPEFKGLSLPDWLRLDRETKTLLVNMALVRQPSMSVRLKGFLTWEPARYGLSEANLNTGLILSSRGIPYFELPLAEYGGGRIAKSSPGKERVCLVAECDQVYSQMNLSRSGLVDSTATVEFRGMIRQLFEHLAASAEYRAFKQSQAESRWKAQVAKVAADRRTITSADQNWVVLDRDGSSPMVLMREPKNETEVIAILWKLESLGALPFARFQTVAHPTASHGPDLFVRFQEERTGAPISVEMFKAENHFRACGAASAAGPQRPNVICWDLPNRGRKLHLNKTGKKYKFTLEADGGQVPVYVMKRMDGLSILSTRELRERGIDI